ncbi:hypothetical protein N665_1294s0007 [Sinapis alba]|nr:hypothetical protein N665_1294s0007 [Sinapis alba]
MARNHTSHISISFLFSCFTTSHISLFFFGPLSSSITTTTTTTRPPFVRRPSITTTTTRAPFVCHPSITTITKPRNGGSKARQAWRLEEEDDGFRFKRRKLRASW